MKHKLNLDAVLTPEQAARWLQVSKRVLLKNIRLGKIPAIHINDRVIRIHPRTVLGAPR